jgi:hypothetical protein
VGTGAHTNMALPDDRAPHGDTQHTSSPRHASAPAGSTREHGFDKSRNAALFSHATPTRRPVQPCSAPTPLEALKYSLHMVFTYI